MKPACRVSWFGSIRRASHFPGREGAETTLAGLAAYLPRMGGRAVSDATKTMVSCGARWACAVPADSQMTAQATRSQSWRKIRGRPNDINQA